MSQPRVRKGLGRGRRSYREIDEQPLRAESQSGDDHCSVRVEDVSRSGEKKDVTGDEASRGKPNGWKWSSFIGGLAVGFLTRGNVQPSPQAGGYTRSHYSIPKR